MSYPNFFQMRLRVYPQSDFLGALLSYSSDDTPTTRLFALYVLRNTDVATLQDLGLEKRSLLKLSTKKDSTVSITETGSRFIEELPLEEKLKLMSCFCSKTFEEFVPLLEAIDKLTFTISKEELPVFLCSSCKLIREAAVTVFERLKENGQ